MTPDEQIEQARQLIDDEVLTRTGRSVGDLASGHVARALAEAGMLADPKQRRPVVLLRAEDCACTYGDDCPHGPEPVDALDLAVWLHAELQHKHADLLTQRDSWWNHVNRERAGLQARIDAALAVLRREGPFLPARHAAIEALQGDQPDGPEDHCMNGPAKQHTLRMVEIIKALRAASAAGALADHLDERGSFAPLARAIVDHWPAGEAGRG